MRVGEACSWKLKDSLDKREEIYDSPSKSTFPPAIGIDVVDNSRRSIEGCV